MPSKTVYYSLPHLIFFQANIKKLGDLDMITLDCETPQSSQSITNTLDDLAVLVEGIGMDDLCDQLNLDCNFDSCSKHNKVLP